MSHKNKDSLLILLIIPLLMISNITFAGPTGPISPSIKMIINEHAANRIDDRYIVIYNSDFVNKMYRKNRGQISKAEINKMMTTELAVKSGSGLFMRYSGKIFGSVLHNTNQSNIEKLLSDSRVSKIYADTTVELADTQYSPTWGLDRIDQTYLPLNARYTYQNDGSDVNVFVIDSGINSNHPEFNGKTIPEVSFYVPNTGPPGGPPACTRILCDPPVIIIPTGDSNGHGTHVAGTIAGSTYGVAKNANLHSVKIFGSSGSTSSSVITNALVWLNNEIDENPELLPAVVNMSYRSLSSDTNVSLYQDLYDKGVVLVAAAGNDSNNYCGYPAAYSHVLSVGATKINDQRWNGSNYGTCLDIFAPGHEVVSANYLGGTAIKTGTSMAAPHVVGGIAMYLQSHQNATQSEVKNVLLSSASDIDIGSSGNGSPNKLLNITDLTNAPVTILPDAYDDVPNQRAFDDDVPGDSVRIYVNQPAQIHNFHDIGDTDWTIFAIPHGAGNDITTVPLGDVSAQLVAYQIESLPQEIAPGRWDIEMSDLIQIDSDQSNGSNSVTIQNTTGEIQAYVIKATTSSDIEGNTDYSIVSTKNEPVITVDAYDDVPNQRAFSDDVPGDAERIYSNQASQIHNFHDYGDEDWTIFAIGDGTSINVLTRQYGAASAHITAYRVNGLPEEISPGRWDISLNDLITVDQDHSDWNNSVVVQNSTGSIQAYVIKVTSSGPVGVNTDYTINLTTN